MARIALLEGYYTYQNGSFLQSNLDITDNECGKDIVAQREESRSKSPGPAAFLTLSFEARKLLREV